MIFKTQKKFFLFLIILLFSNFIFANSPENSQTDNITFSTLLANYKKNNRDYQKLEFQLQQTTISYEKTLIENGINFSVSSGKMGAEFAESSTKINISPELSVSSTKLNNSSISMNLPFGFELIEDSISSKKIDGASLMLSTDIISDVSEQKKLAIEKANRNVLEAQRNLSKGEVKIYSTFLQELRELYSKALSVTQAENDLIEKQIDFNTVKAQGYSTSSAKYRTASLEVESAKRTVNEKQRLYNSALAIFASKCSVKTNQIDLNLEIPQVKLNSINDFSKENFEELEKANWNYQMNTKSRNINTDFSLSAQAGYGFSVNEDVFSDSAQAGLTMNYKGISISTTTTIPINQNSNPKLTLGLGWNPSSSKVDNLSAKNNELQDKIEKLEIQDAQEKFLDTVLQMNEKQSNLEWETEQNIEQAKLYSDLEQDMKIWFSKGVVSESEYRKAKINSENANVKLALTKIDRIIYNNDLSLLFVNDLGETSNEN